MLIVDPLCGQSCPEIASARFIIIHVTSIQRELPLAGETAWWNRHYRECPRRFQWFVGSSADKVTSA
jgi:hypothetical protein